MLLDLSSEVFPLGLIAQVMVDAKTETGEFKNCVPWSLITHMYRWKSRIKKVEAE